MGYQALYRKYRPLVFEDVVGQTQISSTLKNQIGSGKISHAYLFSGTRGTGKTTCSKIMAKAVNCLSPSEGDPCCKCEICLEIDSGAIMDVVEIDAASNNGVDNIRELREEAYYTPAKAKYRVYIIDEVHMLSTGAFNALLKIMEEPPAHVIFILATTELHKVPATIMSRCQRYDFTRINPGDIAERLGKIAVAEGFELDDDAALLIAKLSDGAMRDSLSLLEVAMAADTKITSELISRVGGLSDNRFIYDLTTAIAEKDAAKAIACVAGQLDSSIDYSRACDQLMGHMRNLVICQSLPNPDGFIVAPEGDIKIIRQQAELFSSARLVEIIEALSDTSYKMARASDKKMEFELCAIKLTAAGYSFSTGALLERIEKLERRVASMPGELAKTAMPTAARAEAGTQAHPMHAAQSASSASYESQAAAPAKAGAAKSGSASLEPFERWDDVLTLLRTSALGLSVALKNSKAYISSDIVLIDCEDDASFRTHINSGEYSKNALKEAIASVSGRKYRIGPYVRDKAEKTEAPEEKSALDQLLENAESEGLSYTVK